MLLLYTELCKSTRPEESSRRSDGEEHKEAMDRIKCLILGKSEMYVYAKSIEWLEVERSLADFSSSSLHAVAFVG
jgi:hypothetical protein